MAFDSQSLAPLGADPLDAARDLLHRIFGFQDFRPGQADIIAAVLAGRDVLGVMPTGAGKSLCYQLPALLGEGTTLVVSPLIALMRDQVAALARMGIAAGALTSGNSFEENRETAQLLNEGRLKLLYLAPERLVLPGTLERLQRVRIDRIAVDEAHCISQWGHDFRPEYLEIGRFAEALGGKQLVAFTATADRATRGDIEARLFSRQPVSFIQGFYRANLRLAMQPKERSRDQLLRFLQGHAGESGIIYAGTRNRTEALAQTLERAGIAALAYHAGLPPEVRAERQQRFQREDGLVMVATVAFGMGIDKPDIRFVAHADMPKSVEGYYQEVGRAGRDGLPAETLTLFGLEDMRLRSLQIEESEAGEAVKRTERQRLSALIALMESPACRWQVLRRYFGEEAEPCGHCDVCQQGVALIDGTIPAQKALSAILRTGQRFGTEHLVDLLLGEKTERMLSLGHDRLPTFGVGQELERQGWRGIFRQIYGAGLIAAEVGGHGGWFVTEEGRRVLRGQESIRLRQDPLQPRVSRRSQRASLAVSPAASGLLARLKAERLALAKQENVPAYVIFPDRTLIEMAEARPRNLEALARVHGVGNAKLQRYGDRFLAVIASADEG